jgi:hypothetical protein
MNYKNIISFSLLILALTGCATWFESSSQTEWISEVRQYKKACREYFAALPPHQVRNTPEEKLLSTQDFYALRCRQDPFTCSPPTKSKNLLYLEKGWNKPVSPEACLFKESEL